MHILMTVDDKFLSLTGCYLKFLSDVQRQGQIISLTGLAALSIALWKPNVIVTSLALDFEREENR